jgi:hypothetical protein
MNFEHLIEINDPGNPLLEPLSRQQLWQGLALRAENPELSVIGLDACVVLNRSPNYLRRELRFGHMRVNDEVFFTPLEEVRYEVMASELFPASRLVMRIEEPVPGRCFVRFIYSDTAGTGTETEEDQMVRDHLKQAYIQTDQDTIAVIRELGKMGKLGPFVVEESTAQPLH